MEDHGVGESIAKGFLGTWQRYVRKFLAVILGVGPIPHHIAFIMDGNRRYAKKRNLAEGEGHKAGFVTLLSLIGYCFEFGVRCVTVYAFSVDNFKRKPEEVHFLMELIQEKIEQLLSANNIVNEYGIRIRFAGNLKLLSDPVRASVDKAMKATADNSKRDLLICLAYSSTDEIVHAVEESCKTKLVTQSNFKNSNNSVMGVIDDDHAREDRSTTSMETGNRAIPVGVPSISLTDIEKRMYMGVVPDPDIVIRSGGEARLSNFLLWQTAACPLHSPLALWPELRLRHLVWSLLKFQRSYHYVQKKKKQF